MTEPTKEEIEEFWKWCGRDYYWNYEEGYGYHLKINLNNLFKYAVSKLQSIALIKNPAPSGDVFWNAEIKSWEGKRVIVTEDNPAIALFRAIQEVKNADR